MKRTLINAKKNIMRNEKNNPSFRRGRSYPKKETPQEYWARKIRNADKYFLKEMFEEMEGSGEIYNPDGSAQALQMEIVLKKLDESQIILNNFYENDLGTVWHKPDSSEEERIIIANEFGCDPHAFSITTRP